MQTANQANAGKQGAPSRRYTAIEVTPIPGVIGAVVECGDVKTLDDGAIAEIRRAWIDNLVILFRGQRLTDPEQLAFTQRFGELEKSPQFAPVNPYISVVSNILEGGVPIGSLGDGEAIWHTDMSNREIPPDGSCLYALEVPPGGGETGFMNMYHALETMPRELRSQIEGRTIYHDGGHNSAGFQRKIVVSARHPIVRTHPESGCDALYLGRRRNSSIDGLPPAESAALLDALWAHATRPEFAWHHAWKVGDMVMWDNRCAIHHRNAFDPASRRLMHRSQLMGTRPAFDPSAKQPHARSRLAAHS